MTGKTSRTLVAFACALPLNVLALGVGQIDVRSALNEELIAEIALTSVTAAEADTLEVSLASAVSFQQAGVERVPVLASLVFDVVYLDEGRAQVRVTSAEPLREPLLNFLVEFRWTGGRLVREFVVFLDPPQAVLAQPGASALAATPVRPATPSLPSAPAVATRPGASYGPVQRGETLWRIADRMRPGGVSVHDMMNALLAANPTAFNRPSVDALRAGAVLRIPDLPGVRVDTPVAPPDTAVASAAETAPAGDTGPRVLVEAPDEEPVTLIDEIQTLPGALVAAGSEPAFRIMLADGRPRLRVADLDDLRARISGLVGVDDAALTAVIPAEPAAAFERPADPPDAIAGPVVPADIAAAPAGAPDEAAVARQAAAEPPVSAAPAPRPAAPPPAMTTTTEPAAAEDLFTRVVDTAMGAVTASMDWVTHQVEVAGLRENPSTMAAGGGAAVLLLGLLTLMMRRRRGREDQLEAPVSDPGYKTVTAPVTDAGMDREERTEDRGWRSTTAPASGVTNPMERVDLLLAVGNYREAENVARAALAEDVTNVALGVKLLEVHYATSNEAAFAQEAELLYERLGDESDPQWEQVRNMGRRLCPDHALFGGQTLLSAPPAPPSEIGSESVGQGDEFGFELGSEETTADDHKPAAPQVDDDDLDLKFDLTDWERQPADIERTVATEPDPVEAPPPAGETRAPADDLDEFDLDMELPSLDDDEPTTRVTPDQAAGDRGDELGVDQDDDLDNLQFFNEENRVRPADQEHDPLLDELKDLDFGLELEAADPDTGGLVREQPLAATDAGPEAQTTELDDERSTIEDDAVDADDHVETKLALAEAYLDLDDKDGARGLLEEVLAEGSESQRKRAEEILSRVA